MSKTAAAAPRPFGITTTTVTAADAVLNEEQRERIGAWLRANEINPADVTTGPITIEERGSLTLICFTEYYQRSDGQREINYHTMEAAQVERTVEQKVPLAPDPLWLAYQAQHVSKPSEQRSA